MVVDISEMIINVESIKEHRKTDHLRKLAHLGYWQYWRSIEVDLTSSGHYAQI